MLVARDVDRLGQLGDTLPAPAVEVIAADLSTEQGCHAVMSRLDGDDDAIDMLVNCAGIGTNGSYPNVALEQEESQLQVNVAAVLRLSWAAARAMRRRGHGSIVNVASTAAIWSTGTYAASKAWVVAATDGLAAALADDPVDVLCVIAGFTRTEFHDRSGVDNSGVRPWLWLDPDTIVRDSLAALGAHRTRCTPGRQYRALVPIVSRLPVSARRALLRRLAPLRPVAPPQ